MRRPASPRKTEFVDILSDLGRQKRRLSNLKALAQKLRDDFEAAVAKDGGVVTLNEDAVEESFHLYLDRLRAFKTAAGMDQSLANPVKIAALQALCILETPAFQVRPYQDRSVIVYRQAWFALHFAADTLGLPLKRLDARVRTDILQTLSMVGFIAEVSPEAKAGTVHGPLGFQRRMTVLATLFELLRRAVPMAP